MANREDLLPIAREIAGPLSLYPLGEVLAGKHDEMGLVQAALAALMEAHKPNEDERYREALAAAVEAWGFNISAKQIRVGDLHQKDKDAIAKLKELFILREDAE
ncbi:hypothetical protein WJS89_10415 [Sphingomicrobium sp. XHP0235]|uniref:hypothetical protein n=1 Tax=Sphingomicrobium aquimarinum TaxID=3133971 RepID=UPI0031FEC11B